MKLISDMDDANYFERRAQVLIEEARAIRLSNGDDYEERIIKAIQLLTLAALNQ